MDVMGYCDKLRSELTGWKANLDKITGKLDKASPEDRQRYASSMEDLQSVINDLESGITSLEKECPVDWGPQKKKLDQKAEEFNLKYRQMAAELSPDDFD